MKTPVWEPSAGALLAWLLANQQATPVDLWTITLQGGTVLRYSGADVPITVNGSTWLLGASLQRTRISQRIGVSVDTMTASISADSTALVNVTPILQALAKRVFDGAELILERAFLDDAKVCRGVVGCFYGRFGPCKVSRNGATAEVRSHSELLDVMIPGDLYQPGCRNTVFDAACGLSAAAYTVAGVASGTAGDTTRRTLTSVSAPVIAKATGWGDMGVITFTSGANLGQSRTVRTSVLLAGTTTVTAVYPFPFAITAGDAFTLRAGCNKTNTTCASKFANIVHFRGEPWVPAPETVI